MGQTLGVDPQAGVGRHVGHQRFQLFSRQEVQLKVLGPATNRLSHLMRLGGGHHEHHVGGRLLERLQQSVLSSGGQHVDLVEQVHLGPPRGTQGNLAQQVSHVIDLVVGGRVQLVEIEGGAGLDGAAGLALTARFSVDRAHTVKDLGQDPGRCGLTGAPGAAKQVGVEHPVLAYRVGERGNHMLLSPDLGEPTGPVAPVEGRVLHASASLLPTTDSIRGRAGGMVRRSGRV